jgi:hypothetical protein
MRRPASIHGRLPHCEISSANSGESQHDCQRTSVSGRMIITALRIGGNQRYGWIKAGDRRELDTTAHLALQHDQLLLEHGIFRFSRWST